MQEELAAVAHQQWTRWMRHFLRAAQQSSDGSLTLPGDKALQWISRMEKQYSELPEHEKVMYRKDAQKMIDTANTCLGIIVTKEREK